MPSSMTRLGDGWMRGSFVLDDFQRPDPGALLAPGAQKQASVGGWPKQNGACRRQVGLGVKIFGDTDGVPEDGGLDVVVRHRHRYPA